ncbi:CoA-binding protein [Magnetospirillum molischianum]|uniref:Putative CoA-binding protein n=1 Tax=Magnetospirillum molischianum DSM 120 TaxID=1150626 RepID=H8FPQ3_MAGML|nr:CoA-binding protein [Magnetospirillum molischianum]CCG40341.1 putative CoA-binding protein [Magnetospirillum molischianum DSM 120]
MSEPPPLIYSDETLRSILRSVRTIAVVGASADPNRPSHEVMAFLECQGYRIVAVNPALPTGALGPIPVYPDLVSIPGEVDMVDVFRRSEAAGAIADQAIAIGARVLWMQLGVRDDNAAIRAEKAGLTVVMDRCPKIELRRLKLGPI